MREITRQDIVAIAVGIAAAVLTYFLMDRSWGASAAAGSAFAAYVWSR